MPDDKPAAKKAATRDPGKTREAVRGAADELTAKRTAVADALYDYRTQEPKDVDLRPVWEHLARPFPQEDVERLPRNLTSGDRDKGRCEAGSRYCADEHPCGGWHARSIHLDYIGHAGITMRLNDTVGPDNWTLEPMALNEFGLPTIRGGEFWARLTILGVTKMEVATNFSSTQEALGDVLRRAASRFGVGTYLWSKSERSLALKRATDDVEPEAQRPGDRDAGDRDQGQATRTGPSARGNAEQTHGQGPAMPAHQAILLDRLNGLSPDNQQAIRNWWPTATWEGQPLPPLEQLTGAQAQAVMEQVERLEDPWAATQTQDDPWATPGPGASGEQPPH